MSAPSAGLLWVTGMANLILTAVGVAAGAAVIGLPLFLISAAGGMSQEMAVRILLYSAVVWAPVGAGAGLFVTSRLTRGVRRSEPGSN